MRKILIVLITLLTLVAFVACDSDSSSSGKDPVKDNLAIGTWTASIVIPEYGTITLDVVVKSDKTVTMDLNSPEGDENYVGTWAATSTTEGSFLFIVEESEELGTFKATASTLTINFGEDLFELERKN